MSKKKAVQKAEAEPEIQGYCPGCDEPRIKDWIWHKPCCPYDPGDHCPPFEEDVDE